LSTGQNSTKTTTKACTGAVDYETIFK